jgi:uncharacterized membrane protein
LENDKERIITELGDVLDQDIEAIVSMRIKAERKVGRHQRLIERLTNAMGRPFSVYALLILVLLWILVNVGEKMLGLALFDAPPFPWLQDVMSIGAFFMTVVILTTQNRQSKEEEQRRHLELQINLLTERKVSKLISLLEDLRRDMPHVENRVDPEAKALQEPVDPHDALKALNETWREAVQEIEQHAD